MTLVEVALLACIVGILLAVGIPAFGRALETSKLAEPPMELERMYVAAASYYAATTSAGAEHCLPKPAGPTPAAPSMEPVSVDFAASETEGSTTWVALAYEPQGPIRYRYRFTPRRTGCGLLKEPGGAFALSLQAEGDLDGDGMLSLFERNARLEDGTLVPDPLLVVRDAVE